MAASKQRTEHNRLAKSFHSGLTKSALERYLTDNEQGLDLIEANQRRAAELVRSFKRLAIDRAREEVISFSLDQVINDLMKTLHHRLKVAHVKTELKIPDINMSGTPGILSQVVQNLVMNVIHHAFEPELGGKLTISATLVGEQVELRVSDNGKGIAPDLLPTLFDPFVTSKRSHGNTGLGMHFVHQWVTRSLKGSIAVETEPHKGTTFVLTIPQQVQLNLPED
jgi:signal transduction histidine kinase